MTAILDGAHLTAPISWVIGCALHAVSSGRIFSRDAPEFESLHPMGAVHGGWYGTLLDSAMACAVMTKVPKGSVQHHTGIQGESGPPCAA